MAFSRITTEYTGTNVFAVDFTLGYLEESHVKARVNDEVDGSNNPLYRDITFLTPGTISLSGTLTNGDIVVLTRETPKDTVAHDYADGEELSEANLDDSFLQAIMIAHEALDGRLSTFEADLDMGNHRIKNIVDAVDDQDVPSFAQLKSFTGDAPSFAAAAATSAGAAAVSAAEAASAASDANDDAIATAADRTAVEVIAASLPSNNFVATVDPTVTDDTAAGYAVGSRWINLTTDDSFICVNATNGAAVWQDSSLTIDDLGTLAVLNAVNNANWSGADLDIVNGGTGASTASAARTNLDVYSKSEVDVLTSQRTAWSDVGTDLDDFSGTATSVTNTYGANLDKVETRLVCLVAEGGYAVGDIVDVGASVFFGLNTSYGLSVSYDNTNVTFSGGTLQWFMSPKAGGTAFDPTPTSWKLQYRLIRN